MDIRVFFCKAFFWKVLFSLSKINFWKGTTTWNCKKFRWKQRQRRCFQWSSMTYFVVQKLSPRAATGGEPQNIISQTKKFRPFAIRFFHLTYSIPSLPLLTEPSSPTKPESTVLQKFSHTDHSHSDTLIKEFTSTSLHFFTLSTSIMCTISSLKLYFILKVLHRLPKH